MCIRRVTLLHLCIPFRGHFEHALKTRSASDTILVCVEDDTGHEGWGEILPRAYVTGETVDDIMSNPALPLVAMLPGLTLRSQDELEEWIDQHLEDPATPLALFGGLELALWSLIAQRGAVDLDVLLGPQRRQRAGHCITIGFDAALDDLRARAIHARLQRATVVKLKVGLDVETDAERVAAVSAHLGGGLPIRLDGNGSFTLETASALLGACREHPVQSFEEPLAPDQSGLAADLTELYARHAVPLVADESLCSLADARGWLTNSAYQIFNLRVGKVGGLRACRRLRDLADEAGIALVGGSMVGESGVLTQASELLLARSDTLPYVEGLGQNRSWLSLDPVELIEPAELGLDSVYTPTIRPFRFREAQAQPLVQAQRVFD